MRTQAGLLQQQHFQLLEHCCMLPEGQELMLPSGFSP